MTAVYADPHVLWARLLRRTVRAESGCWIFTGSTMTTGYGIVGSGARGKNILTHRLAVIVRDGAIPDGMTVDHACHDSHTCREKPCPHRRCVNPAHLQVLTVAENNARKFEAGLCRNGHPLTMRADGRARRCKTCQLGYAATWRNKERAA